MIRSQKLTLTIAPNELRICCFFVLLDMINYCSCFYVDADDIGWILMLFQEVGSGVLHNFNLLKWIRYR